MKKCNCIKILLFFLVILFTAVGCGGKNSKNKELFLKIKLNRVNDSDSNVSIYEYSFHGHYEGCEGKSDKSSWILSKNEKISNLVVKENDKKCKLNFTNFFINADKYTIKSGVNLTYSINSKDLIIFENEKNKNEIKFVTAKVFPEDFSISPYVDIEINSKSIKKIDPDVTKSIGEIFGMNSIRITSSATLSVTEVKRPEYNSDFSGIVVRFGRTGRAWFSGNYILSLDNGGQTANKYFFIINNSLDTQDYSAVNTFYKNNINNSDKVKSINSYEQSRIVFSPDYLTRLAASVATEKGSYLYVRLVLVNSFDNSNSYSVYGLNIRRPTN